MPTDNPATPKREPFDEPNCPPLPASRCLVLGRSGPKRSVACQDDDNTKLLNATGRLIWALCDGTRTRRDILQALKEHFDGVKEDVLARDLDRFINDLVAQDFLRLSSEPGVTSANHEAVET